MASKKNRLKDGACSYCGAVGPLEVEHVITIYMYQTKSQAEIMIPSCGACNDLKSQYDDELRDFSVLPLAAEYHSFRERAFEKMQKSMDYDSSDVGDNVIGDSEPFIVKIDDELHELAVGTVHSHFPESAIRFISRGVFFWRFERVVLPEKVTFCRYASPFDPVPEELLFERFQLPPTLEFVDSVNVARITGWERLHIDSDRIWAIYCFRLYGGPAFVTCVDTTETGPWTRPTKQVSD